MRKDVKKNEKKKLKITKLERKVVPSSVTGKKPAIPVPYSPGTRYGLSRRENIEG